MFFLYIMGVKRNKIWVVKIKKNFFYFLLLLDPAVAVSPSLPRFLLPLIVYSSSRDHWGVLSPFSLQYFPNRVQEVAAAALCGWIIQVWPGVDKAAAVAVKGSCHGVRWLVSQCKPAIFFSSHQKREVKTNRKCLHRWSAASSVTFFFLIQLVFSPTMQWEGRFGAFHNRDESQSVWAKYLESFCHSAVSDGDGCGLPSLLPINQNCQQLLRVLKSCFFFLFGVVGVLGGD